MANNSATMTKQTETTNRETTRSAQYFTPRVDIFETDSELVMLADMPGVAPQDIDLRYDLPIAQTKILEVRPVQGTFEIAGAQIVAPGDPYAANRRKTAM